MLTGRFLEAAAAIALMAGPALAQTANVNTAPEPLGDSLRAISRQTGTDVLFAPQAVAGLYAPAVHGQMTATDAVNAAIEGTALEGVSDDNGGLVVRPRVRLAQTGAAAAPAADPAPATRPPEVETVVVTADKRAENQQNVPLSVLAITASTLSASGISGTRDLTLGVPGVQFTQTTASGNFYMRGIGNPNGAAGDQGATAVYVDGVYIPDLFGAIFSFNNIERVEVLKGPQGTLFGRNAAAGVVQIITRDPSQTPMADISAGYGDYNTVDLQAYGTTGITNNLAADVAIIYHDQMDGFGTNYFNGKDINKNHDYGIRTKWRWTPDANTTLTLAGDYFFNKGDFGEEYRVLPGEVGLDGATVYRGFYNNDTDGPTNYSVKTGGVSLTADRDLGWADLTSITAYRLTNGNFLIDQDVTASPLFNVTALRTDRAVTEEARLTSEDNSWAKWLVGVFYMHDKASYDPANPHGILFGGPGFMLHSSQFTDSYAIFAQGSKEIFPATELTLGIRYSLDHVQRDTQAFSTIPAFVHPFYSDHAQYGSLTYRVALDHHFSDTVMGYVSYDRGFKAGLYNISVPTHDPAVRPETVDAFEAGLKSQFFDNRLLLNAAAFYYLFDNSQLRQFGAAAGSYFLLNAASGKSKGIDLDMEAVLTDRFSISGGLELLDAKYTKFPGAPYTYPQPAVCTPGGPTPGHSTGPSTGGDLTCVGDAAGNHMIGAPPVTANLSAQYRIPLDTADLIANAMVSYNGGFYFEADNRLKQPAYTLVNASLDWVEHDGKWELDVWGKNLTSTKYYLLINSSGFGDFAAPAAPLTFGASIKLHLE